MESILISQLVKNAVEMLRQQGYGAQTLRKRAYSFLRVESLHVQKGVQFFNKDLVVGYIRGTEERFKQGEIKWQRCKELTKAAEQLMDLHDNEVIHSQKRSFKTTKLPDYYEAIFPLFIYHESWSAYMRKEVCAYSRLYFQWLIGRGHDDLTRMRESEMREYLTHCSRTMTGVSLNHTKRVLKRMCLYLFECGILKDTCERFLSFSVPEQDKIKSAIPHSEIASTLCTIDCGTHIGRRDYAMLLLAVVNGLRSVDIINLRLSDIDWVNGEIRIIQQKTGVPLALALTTDVAKALRDYILHSRPESALDFVFLTLRAPIRSCCRSVPTVRHNWYRNRAGLPSNGVHGLRRALGTNMVVSGTPVTTVSQVLGHKDFNSARQYISLDSKHLKECALDLKGIELKGVQ